MPRPAAPPEDPAEALRAAVAAGLRSLALRERSAADVRDRLARQGYAADVVDEAVARLRQAGALDEARAARAVARTLILVRRRGRLRAAREMEASGFPPELIRETLAELVTPDDEREALARAIERRLRGRSLAAGDRPAARRLAAALVRQGFPPAAVRDALRRLLVE